jgi:Domain of unknown function (DUF4124)
MVTAMNRLDILRLPARLFGALALATTLPAHGGLYKCAGEKGAVIYQDGPCAPGRELRNLETDPAQLSVVPGTPVPLRAPAREATPKRERIKHAVTKTGGGDPAQRRFLRTGMTASEVMARVGRPDMQLSGRRKEGQQWSYLPTAGDADTLTTVTFAGGTVSRVERKVVR